MADTNVVFKNTFSTMTFFNPDHNPVHSTKYDGEFADNITKTQSWVVI